jgi:hypothetical protein
VGVNDGHLLFHIGLQALLTGIKYSPSLQLGLQQLEDAPLPCVPFRKKKSLINKLWQAVNTRGVNVESDINIES